MKRRREILTCIFCSVASMAAGQISVDDVTLDSVEVSHQRTTPPLQYTRDGNIVVRPDLLKAMPRMLGNADPMRFLQTLPGVQTNSEYDAGLHIQGCDNGHNFVAIEGVPIYNASHLLGIFSTFNASHYRDFEVGTTLTSASSPNRLGGLVNMRSDDTIPAATSGEAAVGPMSSQGSLRLPLGHSVLILSARASYLNLLYGQWLQIDGDRLRYSFYDLNATWLCRPSPRDKLWIDLYAGDDDASFGMHTEGIRTALTWENRMAAIHWIHTTASGGEWQQDIYATHYHAALGMTQGLTELSMPSEVADLGAKLRYRGRRIDVGADLTWHDILPQSPTLTGHYNTSLSQQARRHSQEHALWGESVWPVGRRWKASIGLRGTLYAWASGALGAIDPDVAVTYGNDLQTTEVRLCYAQRHQYLHQAGITSLGMPTEFWFPADDTARPERAHIVSARLTHYLAGGRYQLTVDAYGKRLFHQVEYRGTLLDILNTDLSLSEQLLHGHGYNYGFSIAVRKNTGPVTGWISYAYGRARRRFSELGQGRDLFPANHERPHEVNAVASWRLSGRWLLGGTFVLASGTPFTAPTAFYIYNGTLIAEYGPHNGNRLDPYCRLDLSANFVLKKSAAAEHGINVSAYNALCMRNSLYARLKFYNGQYGYRTMGFGMRGMPSVNYYLKF